MRAAIYIITLLVTPLWAGTPEAMVLLKANCFSCHNPDKDCLLYTSDAADE